MGRLRNALLSANWDKHMYVQISMKFLIADCIWKHFKDQVYSVRLQALAFRSRKRQDWYDNYDSNIKHWKPITVYECS